jgi:hypothetical protein
MKKPKPKKKLKLAVPAVFKAHHETKIVSERKSLSKVIKPGYVITTWPEHLRATPGGTRGQAARKRADAATDDWGK